MEIKRITIAGLGLIGGSLAKAFRRTNPGFEIIGMDKCKENLDLAIDDGTIDKAFETIEEAVQESQVIFLCTPVQSISGLLNTLAGVVKPGTIITDAGSTKMHIMEEADRILPKEVYFIGGHPMAGTERSGYSSSIAHLFENAYYVLTPQPGTPNETVKSLELLISSAGALPLILDPLTHDQRVGAVSHLPHIVAAALVNAVKESDGPDHSVQKLAAGGFKDITRIASSNPEMWRDICMSNKEQLQPMLVSVIRHLYRFGQALDNNEAPEVEGFYRDAKAYRDQLPSLDSLYLLPYYEVYVDIEDKPGMIGEVATILGNHNVNIKNIRIINSREDEPGCLVLSLADLAAQDKAIALLSQEGCRAYKR
jgi:prephenate dehydrogenase